MKKQVSRFAGSLLLCVVGLGCSETNLDVNDGTVSSSLLTIAQTSGQLASGTSFQINDVKQDTTESGDRPGGHGKHGKGDRSGKGRGPSPIDALNLLAPTQELLAIIDAESGGDIRGFRIFGKAGATITNYDANGNVVTLPLPSSGPQGCSFSGRQNPQVDSLLATIAKTVVDFGAGVTHEHDSISITRSGKITITRVGTLATGRTETITYENYKVNGIQIDGTKTRTSTFSQTTGEGLSVTNVVGGRITFADGTVADWTSTRERKSSITFDSNGRPSTGSIITTGSTTIASGSETIYSHVITEPLVEDVSCKRKHRGPVSGTIETHYRADEISIDFGDGTCENQTVTITINGEVTTKTVGA
ncbi:MAG: hypothetical protein ACOYW3_14920 [Bacteroidota bacterium]